MCRTTYIYMCGVRYREGILLSSGYWALNGQELCPVATPIFRCGIMPLFTEGLGRGDDGKGVVKELAVAAVTATQPKQSLPKTRKVVKFNDSM